MHICKFTINNLAPNEAPRNFRKISGTSTTITFQWDRLFLSSQRNRRITQYVITCSSLDGESIFTVSKVMSCTFVFVYANRHTVGNQAYLRPCTKCLF